MKLHSVIFIWLFLAAQAGTCHAYPLDGHTHTGIPRLQGLIQVQQGLIPGPRRVLGAQFGMAQVDIRLTGPSRISLPEADPELTKRIKALLGPDGDHYSLALLDLTNTGAPRYVAINAFEKTNPGSVGKLVVALGIFQALADIYPDSIEKRMKILRSTQVTANAFIQHDHHKVPFWNMGTRKLKYRPIQKGDKASLWTYLDWMMSASSNAAAAIIQKELMLMVRFKKEYPVSDKKAAQFFATTSKTKLAEWFAKSLQEPLMKNEIALTGFRQGSFFTRYGKGKVPGTTSHADPDTLIRFMLKLEQGKMVDVFSSREIKRLLYMTGKRIRYASSPALNDSAVYFKSGSFYKCRPETGFKCRKYQGNILNRLASIAIVEQTTAGPRLHYMVVVMSNVLYKNSAVAHQTLATRLHRLLEKEHKKDEVNSKKRRFEK